MNESLDAEYDLGGNVLLALALGDSLGLPFENLKRRHVRKLLEKTSVRQITLKDGKGLISDDTEHALFTTRAMVEACDDRILFEAALGRQLSRWCRAVPPGIGRATLKSCVKMICGVSPRKSGVRSAGNGPLMRVPAIAIRYRHQGDLRNEFIRISTTMTHTDPRAVVMAVFIGEVMAAFCGDGMSWPAVQRCLARALRATECPTGCATEIEVMMTALSVHDPMSADPERAMAAIGCKEGVSGYILHSAFAACWFAVRSQGNVEDAISLSIEAGGDTDSVAAIAAALAACSPSSVLSVIPHNPFAGSMAGGNRISDHGSALNAMKNLKVHLPDEIAISRQFKDNMQALIGMVRHIFWRRFFWRLIAKRSAESKS
jgi:ADP-ribosyl-[dinitrogen reductase] hydrolase